MQLTRGGFSLKDQIFIEHLVLIELLKQFQISQIEVEQKQNQNLARLSLFFFSSQNFKEIDRIDGFLQPASANYLWFREAHIPKKHFQSC